MQSDKILAKKKALDNVIVTHNKIYINYQVEMRIKVKSFIFHIFFKLLALIVLVTMRISIVVKLLKSMILEILW